ncbi:hypothetical protein STEG23_001609, partial [Scotinomys teguina]
VATLNKSLCSSSSLIFLMGLLGKLSKAMVFHLTVVTGSHLKIETKIERMADLKQLMDNEVLMAFASYATIILTKMMFMSSATAIQRITNKVFANPEDCASFGKGENAKKFLRSDEKVERVRSEPELRMREKDREEEEEEKEEKEEEEKEEEEEEEEEEEGEEEEEEEERRRRRRRKVATWPIACGSTLFHYMIQTTVSHWDFRFIDGPTSILLFKTGSQVKPRACRSD